MRIGLHTSIAGSLEKAALRAGELGANTFQIFSSSPRMWRASRPDARDIESLRSARQRFDLTPLVIHDNYLINLAAADPKLRSRSVRALRGELERAVAIGAQYLVAHPGSYRGWALEDGIEAAARSIVRAAAGVNTKGVMLLIENTAGAGAQIGSRFEELAAIRDLAAPLTDAEIGFCLDTCHALAAGYDLATRAGVSRTLGAAGRVLGLDNVRVIHANDSKAPRGSRLDRHEHIGLGYIGEEGFAALLTHPRLRDKAFILETPRERDADEIRNLEALKRLCRKSRTTTKRSS